MTALLQQLRISHPTGDFCEAADLQWWWRRDQHGDEKGQTFWMDGDRPVTALIFSDWGDYWQCDLIYDPKDAKIADLVLSQLEQQMPLFSDKAIELSLYIDDHFIDKITALGFTVTDEIDVENWMSLEQLPAITTLPDGFKLVSRKDVPDLPHHMIKRNGAQIAERLAECSLYRPDLDLAVYTEAGEVAAYGLFWADPVTQTGLVEPMRTEDEYQRRGLAKHVLTSGLHRLAAAGCSRSKIIYQEGNEASKNLYLGIGFEPSAQFTIYRKAN